MTQNLKENSIWTTSNFTKFKIEKIEGVGDLALVHYSRVADPTMRYSCLIGAFLNRFSFIESE